jgi:hypothetical protein
LAKILAICAETTNFGKKLIMTFFVRKKTFSPKIGQKTPKIAVITSTPGHPEIKDPVTSRYKKRICAVAETYICRKELLI